MTSIATRILPGSAAALQEPDLLDLVGDIYQAGLEPTRWPETLKRISQAFQADLACIYTPMPGRPEQVLSITHNFSEITQAHYSVYYHQLDPGRPEARHLHPGRSCFQRGTHPPERLEPQ